MLCPKCVCLWGGGALEFAMYRPTHAGPQKPKKGSIFFEDECK